MTTIVEFTGQDLAEAIAAAAGALSLPPEKLKFNLVDMGAKGFLGLGRRPARIAVDPADPVLDLAEDEAPLASAREETAPASDEAAEPPALVSEASGAASGAAPPPEAFPKPRRKPPAPAAKPPRPGQATPADPAPQPLDISPPTRPAPGETRVDEPDDEAARLARTVVADILSRLGLAADLTLARLGSRLVVSLDGPDRALLIGSRGATLEALSLLASKIVAKKCPGEGARLILDVADYRFRRHNQVLENLRREVEAVRRTGQPQPLSGLGAADRRLVRLALKPVRDLELKPGRGQEGLVLVPAAAGPGPSGRRRKKPKGETR